MRCHYKACTETAVPHWRWFRFEAPLCNEHATVIHDMVPLPDVNADDMNAESDKLRENIARAINCLRCDYEWDAKHAYRVPEHN